MTEPFWKEHIREAAPDDARAIATVHVQSWRESYRDILPATFLDGLRADDRVQAWTLRLTEATHLTLVGTDPDGRIVGFCNAGVNRDDPNKFQGEVYAIYVLAEAHGRGLGRALFQEAVAWLNRQGWRSLLVWVFTGNARARKFYESLGGVLVGERPVSVAGASYSEVAYGWSDP
jgi:L-amino acid N-acyltransferase YncA